MEKNKKKTALFDACLSRVYVHSEPVKRSHK